MATIDVTLPGVRVIKYSNGITETIQPFPNSAIEDPALNSQPNSNDLGGQYADEDAGNPNADAAKNPDVSGTTSTPTTTAGSAGKSSESVDKNGEILPKRPFNPLSKFSSHTYNIALYMLSPDAFNAYVANGKKSIRNERGDVAAGIYVVAQSGGVNNNVSDRLPGMTMDYYIDNLKIKSTPPGQKSEASIITEITFNIYEPNSFSFISKLSNAAKTLIAQSKLSGVSNVETISAIRQFFILGISFTGYNADGSVAKSHDIFSSDTFTTTDSQAVYERFFDITIRDMKFNLDGNIVNYSIKASSAAPDVALGSKYGIVLDKTVGRGATVQEVLLGEGGIIPFINEQQEKLFQDKKVNRPLVYDIKFVNDPASDRIKNARMIPGEDLPIMYRSKLSQVPMNTDIKKISDVNDAKSVKSAIKDNKVKELKFDANTSIPGIIKKVIQSSTYLSEALAAVNTSQEELQSPSNDAEKDTNKQQPERSIMWYSLSSQIECIAWDKQRVDWAYKITYIISPYLTPRTNSLYAGPLSGYYGPFKRYDYWFTGQNTEVIKYSQSMNVAWFEAESGYSEAEPNQRGPTKNIGQRVDGNQQGSLGRGYEPQASYINSLYSPSDWIKARIEILGDPDYLMNDSVNDINEVYSRFYQSKDSYAINPNGGQLFIEIDFIEGMDYNHTINGDYSSDGDYNDTGLMNLNTSVLFWDYPPEIRELGVKGISYYILEVASTFSKGKFTQQLELCINDFPNIKRDKKLPAVREETVDDESKRLLARYPKPQTTVDVAASKKPSVSAASGNKKPTKQIVTTPTTPAGVANDDGSNARDQLLLSQQPPVPEWQNDRTSSSLLDRTLTSFGDKRTPRTGR